MEQRESHECPFCGSVMGAEAQPAAMRKHAEALDRLDRIERRLHEAEDRTWRLTVLEAVCTPCQETFVGVGLERGDATLAALRARIAEVRREHAEAIRRSA